MSQAPPKAPPSRPVPAPPGARPALAGGPPSPPATSTAGPRTFSLSKGKTKGAERIGLYGPGGIGKSSLCELLQDVDIKPLVIDLDKGTKNLNVDRIDGAEMEDGSKRDLTFDDVRAILHDQSLWSGYNAVVIDSLTRAELLASQWVVANVPHEKADKRIQRIEDYGFGKGQAHIYDAFVLLINDLEQHFRAGRHVVVVMHECIANVPNPAGEDFIRYEPRLQSPPSGKASVRHYVKEWLDHLFFIGYDLYAEDRKASGSGTRTIYNAEMPTHWAKSRTIKHPVPYPEGDPELWLQLFRKEAK